MHRKGRAAPHVVADNLLLCILGVDHVLTRLNAHDDSSAIVPTSVRGKSSTL
jgi:hypothetical protein